MTAQWSQKLKDSRDTMFLYALAIIYFLILIRYYLIDYFVPDFRLYFNMALSGAKAKDGFSSLFIWFAAFAAQMPRQLTVFCLVLMTLAVLNTSLFIKKIFKKLNFYYYTSIIVLYSCCVFYYFYGKVFYDFPFTAFTYSLCLMILSKLLKNLEDQNQEKIDKIWFLLCSLLGFLLSWKLYNIFCLAGLGLLMLCKRECRNYIINILKAIKKLGLSFLLFLMGYIIGNYNLLIDPQATLAGIRAYSASYDFELFLISKSRVIWDHVNDMPFCFSVFSLITVVIFLFVIPILYKKICYLGVSIFMTFCLYIFIEDFSPGYAWHGFTTGLFIVTFVALLLSEIALEKTVKFKNVFIGVALIVQIFNCFIYYIPLQKRWYLTTETAIHVLEERETEIYAAVNHLANEIGDSYYTIDNVVKRYKPVAVSQPAWKDISIQNTYYAATNYEFLDPLQATNYTHWKRLREDSKYVTSSADAEYIIWIFPECFENMGDVAKIHYYDSYNIIEEIQGNGYKVYLYSVY